MSSENGKNSLDCNLKTDLTLSLPGTDGYGEGQRQSSKSRSKRGFCEMWIEGTQEETSPVKIQAVGWPPVSVRSYRKNVMMKNCKYVKVAVDGAPYLRKADLEIYTTYQELLNALKDMFTCLNICNVSNERKMMDPSNGTTYVPTYEDKDGDWMLIGDVPWKMFVDSCKRLRLLKSSEATVLEPRTSSNGSCLSLPKRSDC